MSDPTERTFSEQEIEIMRATYRALQKHGYADLTIKRIAEEYGKSTAAVHYYYETKDELLADFLNFILEQVVSDLQAIETTEPQTRLDLLLDKLLVDAKDSRNLLTAMLEMRCQAPYNETFHERFQQTDEYFRYMLKAVINHGIDEGTFYDVDAEHVSRALMTIVDGARTRTVVFDDTEPLDTARQTAEEYVDAMLL